MTIETLTALSPLDGRYNKQTHPLKTSMSEYGLIKARIMVEIHWFIALSEEALIAEVPKLSQAAQDFLHALIAQFSIEDALAIKTIERTTNHDVKAIEYWLKEQFNTHAELAPHGEFLHFACTSEDINNLAYGLMLKESVHTTLLPKLKEIVTSLRTMAHDNANIPMLSRTHGQSATPTTLGKEIANVVFRLQRQIQILESTQFLGKLNGAVGNYNAHLIAYPDVAWEDFAKDVVESRLNLTFTPYSTQIECHDYIAELAHTVARIHTILIDWSRDVWAYISLGYFKQKIIAGEVGSSTMPHKVNPIDFENAEGNFGLANALLYHFAEKLPISRWQRDLSDSTVLRSLGSAFGYGLIGYNSLQKGLDKLEVNETMIINDLKRNVEVLAEPIQTVMRRYGIEAPYEKLKALTRGQQLTQEDFIKFIEQLELPVSVKARLSTLTPERYTGLAARLAQRI